MNLDERVGRLVDQRYQELLEVFQDSGDRTKDLTDRLDRLINALPLIQDIKTEVADIQKKVSPEPQSEEDEEKKEPTDPGDETNPDVLKFLEDLTNNLLDLRQLKDGLLLDSPKYPALPGWGKGKFNNKSERDYVRLFYYLYKKLRDLKDSVTDAVVNNLSRNQIDYIVNTTREMKNLVDILTNSVTDKLNEISGDLEECCSSTQQLLEVLGDDISTIKRKVNELTPGAQKNDNLALMSRSRAILSEIQVVRGLL